MLSREWRDQERGRSRAFRGQEFPRDEEVDRLKWELDRVRRERDFLKDAVVFFARDIRRGKLGRKKRRVTANEELTQTIRHIHTESGEVYGSPKI